jgi:flavin reductase (DIM6/NTAB) family NADH-FMN oxidoreductase RutF
MNLRSAARADAFIDPDVIADPHRLAELGLRHNPVTALVVPRPIGWISTLSVDGVANLAPFSFFNMVSQSPPMVMFCANASHADGEEKDSLRNARETGEFVANLATWELREQMNRSSCPAPRGIDEFEVAGLTKAASQVVKAPRVAESPISIECRVVKIIDLPKDKRSGSANTVTFGRIVGVHVQRTLIVDGKLRSQDALPLARLGNLDYSVLGEVFEMRRPGWPPGAK